MIHISRREDEKKDLFALSQVHALAEIGLTCRIAKDEAGSPRIMSVSSGWASMKTPAQMLHNSLSRSHIYLNSLHAIRIFD